MKLRPLLTAILLFSLLVPAAGAIYIPGQEIPDDGLPHILLAGADTSVSSSPGGALWDGIFQGLKMPSFSAGSGVSGSSGFSMPIAPTISFGGDVTGQIPDPGPAPYWGGPSGMELGISMPAFNFPALFG